MIRQKTPQHYGRTALLGCAAFALVACTEPTPLFKKKPTDAVAPQTAPKAATNFREKDVEAPEVFQKTAKGLWDGRPSLGGVWVAHPDNKKPHRVIIRNKANGKSVIGAIFNRERSLPGPPFQLSSDAAVALGVTAGSTTEFTVTAMRVEKTPVTKKTTAPQAAPSEDIASETIKALDDEIGKPSAKPVVPDQPEKKISKWKARKLAREAEKAAKTAAASGEVATKTLPKPKLRGGTKAVATPKPAAKPAVAPKPTPKPAAKPVTGGKYAQLGLFSVESNAKSTLAKLKSKGLAGKIVTGDSNGKKYYRVLAGPAASTTEQKKILGIVKSMGFTDAYLVKG